MERPQSFESRYLTIYRNGDQKEMETFLCSWKLEEPDNPEMYIAHSNFFFQNSQEELFKVIDKPEYNEHLEAVYSNSNEFIGYMRREYTYNDSLYNLAIQYINDGIDKNPRRLDMYLGKIYLQSQTGDVYSQKDELLKVIGIHKTDRNQWLWKKDETFENPDLYFKEAIQEHINNLFYEKDFAISNLEEITKAMAGLYPNDVDSFCNLGTCSYIRNNYPQALGYFIKAHEQAPQAVSILNNIVCTLEKMDEPMSAIPYLELIIKHGDQQATDFARAKIEELQSLN